jgi:hypothetical protein
MRNRFHMDVRLLSAGVLAALAALVVLMATAPPERTPIVVAGADLPAGVPIGELDLEFRDVESAAGLVTLEEVGELGGHFLGSSLAVHSPIPRSLLVSPRSERGVDLLGLYLESAAAVHGRLRAGDVVDVYVVAEETHLIAEAVSIVAAEIENTSLGSGRVRLLVAVPDDVGPRVLAATEDGEIHLIRKGS